MRIVPVVRCGDLERSLDFYTRLLDFERRWPGHEEVEAANGVIDLVREGAERRRYLNLPVHPQLICSSG